jgi:hypothetical protein
MDLRKTLGDLAITAFVVGMMTIAIESTGDLGMPEVLSLLLAAIVGMAVMTSGS